MTRLFDRYDDAALAHLFGEAGIWERLAARGFSRWAVAVTERGCAIPHVLLTADKDGRRHRLLDACLRRLSVPFPAPRPADEPPLDVVLVHWVREEDPTARFAADRPALLLQQHPGLGILRQAFHVAVRIADELGADGVASQPKFYHDAVIFQRSRLFLFADGGEQGRFEALQRDLAALPLREASLAVTGWCVRDECGQPLHWHPRFLMFPRSPRLTAYFHADAYAAAVAAARQTSHYAVDRDAVAAARAQLAPPAASAGPV